jgi:hypothetical protein
MNTLEVMTFGCRLNTYESEVIRAGAARAGLGDAVIFNTCAVTSEAVRQARQAIRRARSRRPGARLIVTGCAAQIDAAMFAGMPEVDLVLGNAEKLSSSSYRDFGADLHPAEEAEAAARLPASGGRRHGGQEPDQRVMVSNPRLLKLPPRGGLAHMTHSSLLSKTKAGLAGR